MRILDSHQVIVVNPNLITKSTLKVFIFSITIFSFPARSRFTFVKWLTIPSILGTCMSPSFWTRSVFFITVLGPSPGPFFCFQNKAQWPALAHLFFSNLGPILITTQQKLNGLVSRWPKTNVYFGEDCVSKVWKVAKLRFPGDKKRHTAKNNFSQLGFFFEFQEGKIFSTLKIKSSRWITLLFC